MRRSNKESVPKKDLNDVKKTTSPMKGRKRGRGAVSSYTVFNEYVKKKSNGEYDATEVLSYECYQRWLNTRQQKPKMPEESFRRAITAHVRGADGRRPFEKHIEAAILNEVRKRSAWKCFGGNSSIGKLGFKKRGYHEELSLKLKDKGGNENKDKLNNKVHPFFNHRERELRQEAMVPVPSEAIIAEGNANKKLKKTEFNCQNLTEHINKETGASGRLGTCHNTDGKQDQNQQFPAGMVTSPQIQQQLNSMYLPTEIQNMLKNNTTFLPIFNPLASQQTFHQLFPLNQSLYNSNFLQNYALLQAQAPNPNTNDDLPSTREDPKSNDE